MPSQADLQFTLKMVDNMSATLKQIQGSLAGMGNAASEAKSKLSTLAEVAENVGVAVGGFFASFELASKALEAADEVTSAMFRIQRAALMTTGQMNEFGEAIEEALSQTGGRASEREILGIAEAAAKVGVSGEDLAEFSEDLVKLGLNANGAGDMMATAIGQILNVTEDGTKGFRDYTNEIAMVSKVTGVATDSLVTHARALASATAASFLSKEAVTGLAVITDSLPGRFNSAAGAIQNIFASISSDSLGAREGIRQLSVATGESEAALRSLAQTNPVGLFEKILDRVHDLNGQRLAQDNFLAAFNIQGGEAERVIAQLSSKAGQLRDIISTQEKAKGNTDSIDDAANQSPRTFANSLTALQNAVDSVASDMGKLITPGVILFMDSITESVKAAKNAFDLLGEPLKTIIDYMLIFGGALGGLLKTYQVVKGLAGGIGELLGVEKIVEGTAALEKAEVAVKGVATAEEALATASIASSSKLGGIATLLAQGWKAVAVEIGAAALAFTALYDVAELFTSNAAKGHSFTDVMTGIGALTEKALGIKDGPNQRQLEESFKKQRDSGTGAYAYGAEYGQNENSSEDRQHRGSVDVTRRNNEAEAQAKAQEDAAKKAYDQVHTLDDTEQKAIVPGLQLRDAAKALDVYREALAKVLGMNEHDRKVANISDADVARLQEEAVLEARKADPIANQIRLGQLALDQTAATTRDLKDQVAVRDAINAAIEKDASVANDPEKLKAISAQVYEKTLIEANNAIQEQNISLDSQIAKLVTIGTAAQNALDITIKRAAFDREHGAGSFDSGGLADKERAAQTLQGGQTVVNQYLPQVAAAQKLKDAQEQINAAQKAGLITAQEAALAQQKLTADTLGAVSPLGEIVKNSQREVEYASVLGPLRDSEINALKTINDLKDKGVVFTQKDEAALKAALTTLNQDVAQLQNEQSSGFNGFVQKVGTIQDNLSNLQSSFADGLSSGIDAALTRNRNAFAAAGKAFGDAALKMGTNMVLSEVFKATGLAGPDKDLEKKIKGDQDAVQKIAQASMVINNANVTLNAQGAANLAAGAGVNPNDPTGKYNTTAAGNNPPNLTPEIGKTLGGQLGGTTLADGTVIPGGGTKPGGFGTGAGGSSTSGAPLTIGGGGTLAGGFGTGPGGSIISQSIAGATNAVNEAGASPGGFYAAARQHESTDRNIVNQGPGRPQDKAQGYYQFMPGTWKGLKAQHPELNLPDTPLEATKGQQTAAYEVFTRGNVQALQAGGVPINDKNVFMSSFLGSGGATKFIGNMGRNPNAPAAYDFPKEAANNRGVFYDPKTGAPKSYDQIYGNMTHTFSSQNTTGFGPNSSPIPSAAVIDQASKAAQAAPKTTNAAPIDVNISHVAGNPVSQTVTPSTDDTTSGAAGAIGNGLVNDAAKIPGASPYVAGFNALKSIFNSAGGSSGISSALSGATGAVGDAAGAASGGIGSLFSGLGSILGFLHSGGVVGPNMPTTNRVINPAIFATAKRYHDGLGDDEFPAILQQGERVLTASQDMRNTNAMSRLANAVSNQSSVANTEKPVVPGTNNFRMIVNTPDAPSFRRSSSQVMASMHASMSRAASKNR